MTRANRKLEHMHLALENRELKQSSFEDITFVHQSIPNIDVNHVNIQSKIGELVISSPFFINAMTGGGGTKTKDINQQLAIAARETNIAIAVGSQMAAIKDKSERDSFSIIRKENPNGLIFSNLGSEVSVEQAKIAIDMLEANALQIHLNTVQELVMPEGDREFTGALKRIEAIRNVVEVPIIIKEVGFGLSKETVQKLVDIGISIVDVGGVGGTNFAKIENARRETRLSFFDNWGIPTTCSIVEASWQSKVDVISSGGIQTSMDIAKSIALGASSCGIAGHFLQIVVDEGVEELIGSINQMKEELTFIMTALGCRTINELQKAPIIISGKTHHWLNERNINTKNYANKI